MSNPSPVMTPEFVNHMEIHRSEGNPNWKPGVSGNPAGPPVRVKLVSNALYEMLQQGTPTQAVEVAKAIIAGAKDREPALIKELLDRVEGKVPLPIAGSLTIDNRMAAGQLAELLMTAQEIARAMISGPPGIVIEGAVTELPSGSINNVNDAQDSDNGQVNATQ